MKTKSTEKIHTGTGGGGGGEGVRVINLQKGGGYRRSIFTSLFY